MDIGVGGDAQSEQQIAVPADGFRRTVQDDRRPVSEGLLTKRHGERRVHHHAGTSSTHTLADRRQVGDIESRIGRGLHPPTSAPSAAVMTASVS